MSQNLWSAAVVICALRVNICFGYSKEQSHLDGSFEYPQHMFFLRNKKITFSLNTKIMSCIHISKAYSEDPDQTRAD